MRLVPTPRRRGKGRGGCRRANAGAMNVFGKDRGSRHGLRSRRGIGGIRALAVSPSTCRGPRPRGPLRPPVPVQPRRRGPGHGQRMAGRKLAHHREERPGVAQQVAPDQPGGHGGLVEPVIDAGRGEHRLHGAGEDEAMRGFGVVEGPGADGVAGAEQGTGAAVPHREGVIAEQVVRAVLAPARPGPFNQVRVVEARAFGVRHPERVAECAAVVEAGVRGDREAVPPVDAKAAPGPALPGGGGPSGDGGPPAAEGDGRLRPRRGVRPVIGEGRQHGVQPVRGRSVRGAGPAPVDPADSVHPSSTGSFRSGRTGKPRFVPARCGRSFTASSAGQARRDRFRQQAAPHRPDAAAGGGFHVCARKNPLTRIGPLAGGSGR